jgi:hypothetical protein
MTAPGPGPVSRRADSSARQTLDSGFTAGVREPRSAPHRVRGSTAND